MNTESYLTDIENWRTNRLEILTAKDGWLSLIGRWPIEHGTYKVGADAKNDITLDTGPANVGTLNVTPEKAITFEPQDSGAPIHIAADSAFPVRFPVGQFSFEITSMSGSLALRVRDTLSAEPAKLEGIPHFPTDTAWRIHAEWIRLEEPGKIEIDTVIGVRTDVAVTHFARFVYQGKTYELLSTYGTPERPQFVFRDLTSIDETYQPARFVFGEDVGEDTIVLDFNKAINPPCAFTDFAACPLPPTGNILPFSICAGEKRLSAG